MPAIEDNGAEKFMSEEMQRVSTEGNATIVSDLVDAPKMEAISILNYNRIEEKPA